MEVKPSSGPLTVNYATLRTILGFYSYTLSFEIYVFVTVDLPPVFVPVFKLELNPILNCFVSTEVVES